MASAGGAWRRARRFRAPTAAGSGIRECIYETAHLALDGGGIRGLFGFQIQARIEAALFRQEQSKPELALADVFHLMAGTSTGATSRIPPTCAGPVPTTRWRARSAGG